MTMRGDNDTITVGKGTNIQDNTVIHTDEGIKVNIDENVTVGHKVIIHGASIGANTVVGMGSVVMNHAKVGANCIIGANSLITERKEFPDNSLIMGSPAKIVRELTEEEISVLVFSAKHYIDKSKKIFPHSKKDLPFISVLSPFLGDSKYAFIISFLFQSFTI